MKAIVIMFLCVAGVLCTMAAIGSVYSDAHMKLGTQCETLGGHYIVIDRKHICIKGEIIDLNKGE